MSKTTMTSTTKNRTLRALRDEMRAVARGEIKAPPRPAASICSALSPEVIELYKIILHRNPQTVGELVQLTGRAQPNISRMLRRLQAHHIIKLEKNGRAVRPLPLVDEIRIDLAEGTYQAQLISAPAG